MFENALIIKHEDIHMPARQHKFRDINEICELPNDAWLTVFESALYLNTTPAALAIRRSKGSGPIYGRYSAFIRYQKKALDEWMLGSKIYSNDNNGGSSSDVTCV